MKYILNNNLHNILTGSFVFYNLVLLISLVLSYCVDISLELLYVDKTLHGNFEYFYLIRNIERKRDSACYKKYLWESLKWQLYSVLYNRVYILSLISYLY